MALSKWATERGERVLVVSAVLTSVATILTLLRIYARAFIVKQMGADDWTVIAALVGSKEIRRPLVLAYMRTRHFPGRFSAFLSQVCPCPLPYRSG